MAWLLCSIWQFFLGVLVGWLLSWWMSARCCKKSKVPGEAASHSHSAVSEQAAHPAPQPVAEVVEPVKVEPAVVKAEVKPIKADKLEIIEGIGPKIAGLLKEDGILTFSDLANASEATLATILEKAGPRFKLARPDTWPQQAKLAAEGKMEELKVLQDSLIGGVEAKPKAKAKSKPAAAKKPKA